MEWIKISNQEPEDLQSILAYNWETGALHAGAYYLSSGKFCLNDGTLYDPMGRYCDFEEYYTHWLPIPELPK